MNLSLIVAINNKQVIGVNNQLPWHLPKDLQHFKKTTRGAPVIMGRKTFESIGKPLPHRTNIVLSQTCKVIENTTVFPDLDQALSFSNHALKSDGEVFIIGGSELYRIALPRCNTIYLTVVNNDLDGDAFFPESLNSLHQKNWKTHQHLSHPKDAENPFDFDIYTLKKTG